VTAPGRHADPAPETGPAAGRFATVSNFLSIARAVLAVPFVLVMLSDVPGARWWGMAILAVAALTDKLDGVFARRFNQVTEWGKILDPLADKIGVAAVALVLLSLGLAPLWFVLLVLVRDLLIFAGGVYLKSSRGVVLPSNQAGKWAVGIVTLALFACMMQAGTPWEEILLAAACGLLLLSFAQYIGRFAAVARSPRS